MCLRNTSSVLKTESHRYLIPVALNRMLDQLDFVDLFLNFFEYAQV